MYLLLISFGKEAYMAKIRKDSKGRVLPQGITEVGPNKYKVRFMYHGEQFSETVEGLSKAKRTLEDLKFKGRRKLVEKNKRTLNEWFETCIEMRKIGESTRQTYLSCWNNWIKDGLGKKKPEEISRLELIRFFSDMAKKVGEGRVKSAYQLVNSTLEEALLDNPFRKNPATGVLKNISLIKKENARQKALTEAAQEKFLNYVYEKNDRYKEVYAVLFYTGMRISELAALKISDIDFEKGFINVQNAMKYLKGQQPYIDKPKRDSARSIPLLPVVEEALKSRLEFIESSGKRCKLDEEVVFFNGRQNVITSGILIAHTKVVARRMEEDSFTNHAMRHSFATRLKEHDTQEDYIALVMGHKDITTTRRSYIDLEKDQEKVKEKILKYEIGKIS